MPQSYSEFQLQRNRFAGQATQGFMVRAMRLFGDIFKLLLEGITAIIRGIAGK